MTWNLSAEAVSFTILLIIFIYAKKGNSLPALRNKTFQACFIATAIGIASNIIATICILYLSVVPLWFTWIINIIYFISTPLMGVAYFFYSLTVLIKDENRAKRVFAIFVIPALIYIIMVIATPLTGQIFSISLSGGYMHGPYITLTYIVFYLYCILSVIFSIFNFKNINIQERFVLSLFPFIAVAVIIVQQFFPSYILSGSAATCALLLIYLNLENRQIYHDFLTGLPNRIVLLEMLGLNLNRKKNFVVVVVSLKKFKTFNKIFGQRIGNDMIVSIAKFLQKITPVNRLYRYSGDEFAILLDEDAEPLVASIIERLSEPWVVGEIMYMLLVAIGIVKSGTDMKDVESLVSAIEHCVGEAKKSDKTTCVSYNSEMAQDIGRKEQIVEILKQKIKDNSIELYFQPIYDIKAKTFLIAESLSRLIDTPLGTISPGEFIPIAEDMVLIIPMTYQMLDKACKFVKKVIEDGRDCDGVSVNISTLMFTDMNFEKRIREIIVANDLPFSKIKIEITESVLVDNYEVIKKIMASMNKDGVLFGLDDFGTGYSNISSVLSLPWNTIKLDKSLIWGACEKDTFAIMVSQLMKAFSSLGIRVLAEGVETEEQSKFVIENGSNMIQGFLYATPMKDDFAINLFHKRE